MKRFAILAILLSSTFIFVACSGNETAQNSANAKRPERVCEPTSDTPTLAYKRLFEAVKSKNTELIKAQFSKDTQGLVEFQAQMQKKPLEEVYANGYTMTTMSATLPEIRDERISGCWAGIEVWNTREQRWENLPFGNENGKWALAIGEIFNGQYKEPGQSMSSKESAASNTSGSNAKPIAGNSNASGSTKSGGLQVEPMPANK